jgi:hypothetical protein
MSTPSAIQKYMAIAMMVGTNFAQAAPMKLVRSPTNQMSMNGIEIASALPHR